MFVVPEPGRCDIKRCPVAPETPDVNNYIGDAHVGGTGRRGEGGESQDVNNNNGGIRHYTIGCGQ